MGSKSRLQKAKRAPIAEAKGANNILTFGERKRPVLVFEDGADGRKVDEPHQALVSRRYEVPWKKKELDLSELAISRWVKRKSMEALASEFGLCRTAIVSAIARIKANPNAVADGRARKLVKLKERAFHGSQG